MDVSDLGITAKQLIELLHKCPADSIIQLWTEEDDFSVTLSPLKFVENCSTSSIVRLLNYKPKLAEDIKYGSIKIVQKEECFAETKYYDAKGCPRLYY